MRIDTYVSVKRVHGYVYRYRYVYTYRTKYHFRLPSPFPVLFFNCSFPFLSGCCRRHGTGFQIRRMILCTFGEFYCHHLNRVKIVALQFRIATLRSCRSSRIRNRERKRLKVWSIERRKARYRGLIRVPSLWHSNWHERSNNHESVRIGTVQA